MSLKSCLPHLATAILLMGCASGYRTIDPERMDLKSAPAEGSPVAIGYRHHVLASSGNAIYDDKARKQRLEVMAVSIKNLTDRPINTRTDLDFYMGGENVVPERADRVHHTVRQRTGAYFLYLLMSPITIFKAETTCNGYSCEEDVSYFPIGLIAGLLLTGINAGRSSAANGAFQKELTEKDIYGKTLQPGQEIVGLMVFREEAGGALTARLKGSQPATSPVAPRTPETDSPPADRGDFR